MRVVYFYPIVSTTIWGVAIVLAKILGGYGFDPFEITFGRFLVASIIFLPILIVKVQSDDSYLPKGKTILDLIALSLTGVAVNNTIFYLGLSMTSASISSLLVSLNPLMTMIFGTFLLGEKMSQRKILSTFLGILGVVLIVGIADNQGNLRGNLIILMAVTIWSSSFSFSKRASNAQINSIAITGWSEVLGTLFLFPIIVKNNSLTHYNSISINPLLLFLFLGAGSSVFAYLLHYKAIEVLGSGTVAPSINIIPFSGAFTSWLLLSEKLSITAFLGLILILVGVFIVYFESSPKLIHTKENNNYTDNGNKPDE